MSDYDGPGCKVCPDRLRSTADDAQMVDDLNDKTTARAERVGGDGHTFTMHNPYVADAVAFARSILGEGETA